MKKKKSMQRVKSDLNHSWKKKRNMFVTLTLVEALCEKKIVSEFVLQIWIDSISNGVRVLLAKELYQKKNSLVAQKFICMCEVCIWLGINFFTFELKNSNYIILSRLCISKAHGR